MVTSAWARSSRIVSASWSTVWISAMTFIGMDTSKRSSSSMTMSMIASESMVRSLAMTVSPVIGFSPVW